MTNEESLFNAAAAGDVSALTAYLESSPEAATAVNSQGISLLMWSMYHRQLEAANAIYQRLSNPDAEEAVAVGDTEALRAVITADRTLISQYSSDGFTLLHYACFFSQPHCVKLLLDLKAEINCVAQNPSRVYPIHSAAAAQAVTIVSMLLEAGADPNVKQGGGFVALMSAAAHNNLELIAVLLAGGADKSLRDDAGKTAYQHGAERGFDIEALNT